MSRTARVALGAVVSVAILASAPSQAIAADAAEKDAQPLSVDGFGGALTGAIPIKVPAFHGLEPKLDLQYNSGGSNGFLGAGWSIGAFSVIERFAPGRGAPRWDSSDVYYLDGQELVASSSMGGTHATRIQSYQRIVRDVPNDRWIVTRGDGVKMTYVGIHGTAVGPWKYGVSTIQDTLGNTVTFTYGANQFACCWVYPASITYNGTTITFYWEQRPDFITKAMSQGLENIAGRIKTIDIQVSGARVRSYKLSYSTSANTGGSLLASVQQFGKDATLDSSGTVTGGTALPAATSSYATAQTSIAGWSWGGSGSYSSCQMLFGDFNGDGKTDIYCHRYPGDLSSDLMALSNGSGFGGWSWSSSGSYSGCKDIVTGDFNGDGKTDIYCHRAPSDPATDLMALSNGTGFGSWIWSSSESYAACQNIEPGDFNGDGKTDIYCHRAPSDPSNDLMALSNGTGFGGWSWSSSGSYAGCQNIVMGDYDGDGKTDIYCHRAPSDPSNDLMALSNGTGFGGWSWSSSASYAGCQNIETGDFNGDGKTDIYCHRAPSDPANDLMALSIGNGFSSWNWSSSGSYAGCQNIETGDFNSDGKTDIYCHRAPSDPSNDLLALSSGGGFGSWIWSSAGSYAGCKVSVVDVNGDGKDDIYCNRYQSDPNPDLMALSTGAAGDLLSSLSNGLGGTTTVAYTPSTSWGGASVPVGMIMQTVSSVTTSDGRGPSATTSYQYSGALFDPLWRQFMGFRYVKTTAPCVSGEAACPFTETYFRQDYGAVSMPEYVYQRDGSGRAIMAQVNVYTTNGATVPYTSLNTGQWAYTYDGSGTACNSWPCANGFRSYVSRSFDGYGNITREYKYGNYDDPNSSRVTNEKLYAPNTSAFITQRPYANRSWRGVSGSPTVLLEEALVYYDGATAPSTPPTQGLPTKTSRMTDTTGPTYLNSTQEYDAWGNVVAETNALGARSTRVIDPTYHMFVIEQRDPLYTTDARHKNTVTVDYVCGVPLVKTDANGKTATSTYDNLCRQTLEQDSSGGFTRTSYVNFGSPTSQYIERSVSGANANGDSWTREYFDGLSGVYQVRRKGPSATKDIVEDRFTNERNKPSKSCSPYYADEGSSTSLCVTHSYDTFDRPTRDTNPDGTYTSTSYGIGTTTVTDPAGHTTTKWIDDRGNTTKLREWRGGAAQDQTFTYNERDQVITMVDQVGNVWTNAYDTRGLRTSTTHPDAGTTTFEYDALGRVTAQVDATGKRLEMTYDLLNRQLTKVAKTSTGTIERTVTFQYDQARTVTYNGVSTTFNNVGDLTTMIDQDGTASMNYDDSGRLVYVSRSVAGGTFTMQHGFDVGGRLKWTTLPSGETLGTPASPRTYDDAGRELSLPGYINGATYNAAGQMLSRAQANGTSTTFDYFSTTMQLKRVHTVNGTVELQDFNYTRDVMGRITAVTSPLDGNLTYTYDESGWLTNVGGASAASKGVAETWTYDNAGNILNDSARGNFTYQSAHGATSVRPHAIVAAGTNTYSYDAAGRMTAGAGRTLTWNAEGLPTSVATASGTMTTAYDGQGLRLKKTWGGNTTVYLGNCEVTFAGSTYTTSPFTCTAGFAGDSVATITSGVKTWTHGDHLGSVHLKTNASGAQVDRRTYMAYGTKVAGDSAARGYMGQPLDETGLIYDNARYYDPVLGRFITPDTKVEATRGLVGLNSYAYGSNDPINNIDVSGHGWLKKLFKGIAKAFKAIVNLIKAALHGDFRAILTIIIIVASICVGGLVVSAFMEGMGGAAANAVALVQGGFVTNLAGAAAVVGGNAVAGFVAGSALWGAVVGAATGLVQGGSLKAMWAGAVNGFIGGAFTAAANVAYDTFLLNTAGPQQQCYAPGERPWYRNLPGLEEQGVPQPLAKNAGFFEALTHYGSESNGFYSFGNRMLSWVHDPFAYWLEGKFGVNGFTSTLIIGTGVGGGIMLDYGLMSAFGGVSPTRGTMFGLSAAPIGLFAIPDDPRARELQRRDPDRYRKMYSKLAFRVSW